MADTGYNWDAAWTELDAAIALTTGGTITDTSAAVDCDGKAACILSIDVDYSDHVKATSGLTVTILKDINGTDYETTTDQAWSIEINFTQDGTNRKAIPIDVSMTNKFKVLLDWGNTTGSSIATVATSYVFATIPVAS